MDASRGVEGRDERPDELGELMTDSSDSEIVSKEPATLRGLDVVERKALPICLTFMIWSRSLRLSTSGSLQPTISADEGNQGQVGVSTTLTRPGRDKKDGKPASEESQVIAPQSSSMSTGAGGETVRAVRPRDGDEEV